MIEYKNYRKKVDEIISNRDVEIIGEILFYRDENLESSSIVTWFCNPNNKNSILFMNKVLTPFLTQNGKNIDLSKLK